MKTDREGLGVTPDAPCARCTEGWICAQHPEKGWPHDDCAGPGMPCPRCQPSGRPALPEVTIEAKDKIGDVVKVQTIKNLVSLRGKP
jgi:hypothetical protein